MYILSKGLSSKGENNFAFLLFDVVEPPQVLTRHLIKRSDCMQDPGFDTLHQKQATRQHSPLTWKITVNHASVLD